MSTVIHDGWGDPTVVIAKSSSDLLLLSVGLTPDGPRVWQLNTQPLPLGFIGAIQFDGPYARRVVIYELGMQGDVNWQDVEQFEEWYKEFLFGALGLVGLQRDTPSLDRMLVTASDDQRNRVKQLYLRRKHQAATS